MINRKATIRWKGYDPDNLKPKSSKRVWANCDNCGIGRWVIMQQYCDFCIKCSHDRLPKPEFVSEEDRFIPGTGIDRIETIKEKGYDPANLKVNSNRRVWCICQDCNKGRWLMKIDYTDLCKSCTQKRANIF